MSENVENIEDKNAEVRRLIEGGIEIAGGAIGGALGILSGDPIGAAVLGAGASIVAKTLQNVGKEISDRFLGPREKVRVGGVLAIAAQDILQRTKNGEQIRSDGFFEPKVSGRSDAEEVVESVVLKSQREPEEKKIRYMAFLFSSIAFHSEISANLAHQITKHAEQLTYRQFCLLKIFGFDNFRPSLREENYREHHEFSLELRQVLYECHDLAQRGFIGGEEAVLGVPDITPQKMKTQGLGADMFNLMRLIFIPEEDILPIVQQLK